MDCGSLEKFYETFLLIFTSHYFSCFQREKLAAPPRSPTHPGRPLGLSAALCPSEEILLRPLLLLVQASDSSLLSRLISICSEGRLSSRLFFILWVRRSCFCLIMAPHILCSVESSSSSPRPSSSSSLSPSPSPRLLSLLLLPPPSRLDEEEENSPAERPLDLS